MSDPSTKRMRLGECLEEVSKGIGPSWSRYRLLGATRGGLAAAKEAAGKNPERYKPVEPGTIFYNPMRILLGSIAYLDEGEDPGITSPDYVVFKTKPGVVHPRWFYYWLRSDDGAAFIRTLTRGAVRERMLFRRLAAAEIDVPPFSAQASFAERVQFFERARAAAEEQAQACRRLAQTSIFNVFGASALTGWPRAPIGTVAGLLPSKSVSLAGDTDVVVATTGCLSESGFLVDGVKRARMWKADAVQSVVSRGEILVARSNTPDLVGRAAMFDGDPSGVVASDLTIRLLPTDAVLGDFLAGYLSALYLTGYWKDRAGGASGSMKKITRRQIENLDVPMPPLGAQREIVQRFKDHRDLVDRLRLTLEAERETVAALPAALLRQAFSGEL